MRNHFATVKKKLPLDWPTGFLYFFDYMCTACEKKTLLTTRHKSHAYARSTFILFHFATLCRY